MRSFAVLLACAAAMPAFAAVRPSLAAAQVNGEPVLRYGTQTINRPFGATLVDRLDVIGAYQVKGSRVYLVRGAAAGDCPARYVVIDMQGGQPRPTAPFGTCADGARGRVSRGTLVVTMPSGATGARPAAFAYSAGQVVALTEPAAPVVGGTVAAVAADSWAGPGGCMTAQASALTADQVMADFERGYPLAWRKRSDIDRLDLSTEELSRAVLGLACLATWPAADPAVPKAALPLFASKRHGRRAFDLLEGIARESATPTDIQAAARAFHAEMRFRVERREPI